MKCASKSHFQLYLIRPISNSSHCLTRKGTGSGDDNGSNDINKNVSSDATKILKFSDLPANEEVKMSKNKSGSNGTSSTTGTDESSVSSAGTTGDGNSNSGGGKRTFYCPKCGAVCSHVDALLSSSRFVKCEKCNHFFVIMSDDRKTMHVSSLISDKSNFQFQQQQQQQQQQNQAKPAKQGPPPPPKKIYEFLDKYIIGQEKAKKVISVAVYNHYKRVYNNIQQAPPKAAKQGQPQAGYPVNEPPTNISINNFSSLNTGNYFQIVCWFFCTIEIYGYYLN